MKYVIGIDQSTQGTKLLLFDENGRIAARVDRAHRQIISPEGWVSHDMEEVWANILSGIAELVGRRVSSGDEMVSVGISTQRETAVAWDNAGHPLADAIVWQCARASGIASLHAAAAGRIRDISGLALSPFYPACKLAWLQQYSEPVQRAAAEGRLHFGTVDCYLIYRMTKGRLFLTDAGNASRTQLMDLRTGDWSEELLSEFGIRREWLGSITDSGGYFGETDFDGILRRKVPVRAVMGDSHAALFGHGCHRSGEAKVTYGTGSSVMMNTGEKIIGDAALSTSVAWTIEGRTTYCLEGNINYTGAVNSWLKDDVHLFDSTAEIESLITAANPTDKTIVIPAFTGLSAPYWNNDARAAILNMSRTTGRAEIVKAANESIAMQIADVVEAMRAASGAALSAIHADGGPTKNRYLMQYQADMLEADVLLEEREEVSAMGAAYLAGIMAGLYDKDTLFSGEGGCRYTPEMNADHRAILRKRWHAAMDAVLGLSESLIASEKPHSRISSCDAAWKRRKEDTHETV